MTVSHKMVCSCKVGWLHVFTVMVLLQDEVAAEEASNLELHVMIEDLKVIRMATDAAIL